MKATVAVDRRALAWLAGAAHDAMRHRLAIARPPDPEKVALAVERLKIHLWIAEFFEEKREDTVAEMSYVEFYFHAPQRRKVEAAKRDLSWDVDSEEAWKILMAAETDERSVAETMADLGVRAARQEGEADWNREEYERILKEYPKDVAEEADRRTRALSNPFREELVPPRETELRFLPSGQIMRAPPPRATRRAAAAPMTVPGPMAVRTRGAVPTAAAGPEGGSDAALPSVNLEPSYAGFPFVNDHRLKVMAFDSGG